MKEVYATPPANEHDVINKINIAIQWARVLNLLPRRLQVCLETDGYQVQHLPKFLHVSTFKFEKNSYVNNISTNLRIYLIHNT